jgi:recombination protein RecA
MGDSMANNFDAIFKAVAKKTKEDGLASVHKADDITLSSNIPHGILTGIPELDFNIGKPGWPAGRCVELFGFEHCGKTTLAYQAIAQAQRMGGGGYFIDTEKSWDIRRAQQCGVDPHTNFHIADVDSIEAAFRTMQAIIEARLSNQDNVPFVIVVDSVTGTATEFMREHEMGKEERVGQDARAIRGGMRRITADIANSNINLIMINHAISTIPKFKFAKQSEAAGGHAIKLFSTVRVNLAPMGWITEGPKDAKRRLGQRIMLKVEKLKGSSMMYPVIKEIQLLNTHGFDTESNLLDAGIKAGWVQHAKGSQSYTLYDQEFPRVDWPSIVLQRGGLHAAYQEFIDWCMEEGTMSHWGRS